jgi:hypothetical protein
MTSPLVINASTEKDDMESGIAAKLAQIKFNANSIPVNN